MLGTPHGQDEPDRERGESDGGTQRELPPGVRVRAREDAEHAAERAQEHGDSRDRPRECRRAAHLAIVSAPPANGNSASTEPAGPVLTQSSKRPANSAKTAPWGSCATTIWPPGTSVFGTISVPPEAPIRSAAASMSSMPK